MSDQAAALRNLVEQRTPPLGWRSWPLRENKLRAAAVILGLLLAAVLVGFLSSRGFLGILAAAAIGLSMWRFFLPVSFEVDHRGLSQRFLGLRRYIPWTAIKCHRICDAGVLLLSQKDDDRMAPLRGLYVPWTQHRQEFLDLLAYHLAQIEHR